ncbi:hypothetical protein [Nocardia testacea]|nr:hypothetical protein [Nocardia testacea]
MPGVEFIGPAGCSAVPYAIVTCGIHRCGARVDDHLTRVLLDGLRASKS